VRKIDFTLLLVIFANSVFAKDTSQEFWPELDLWWRTSPALRFSSFISLANNVETKYREGTFIAQGEYSWGETKKILFMRLLDTAAAAKIKSKMARLGYLTGSSLDDQGENYSENTLFSEYHFRIPVKGNILTTQRLRLDLRELGEDYDYSYRIRYRWMIEKEFKVKRTSYVPYLNVEPYYDSRYQALNRVRVSVGSSATWSKFYALEGNITYQHDSRASVTDLYAFSAILHLYFESN
jgi:hypothetical protein